MISEEQNSDDDCDSGNDEPSDYLPLERRASVSGTPQQERAKGEEEEEAPALTRFICRLQTYQAFKLQEKIFPLDAY